MFYKNTSFFLLNLPEAKGIAPRRGICYTDKKTGAINLCPGKDRHGT